jgi:hypothetical protein
MPPGLGTWCKLRTITFKRSAMQRRGFPGSSPRISAPSHPPFAWRFLFGEVAMSKEKSKEYIVLQSIVGKKSVSFHPDFARALGSVTAGLFMSQGFFWQFNASFVERITIDGDEYFSRTISEWEEETALSEEQQKGARALLVKCGILKEKKAGLPARLYYHFDFDALVAVIYRYKETKEQVAVDNRSKKRYLPRTSSGKIRRQDAVNHGDNYKEREFKRVFETTTESEKIAEAAEQFPEVGNMIQLLEEEKKEVEKPPRARAATPAPADPAIDQMEWLHEMDTDPRVAETMKLAHQVPAAKKDEYLAAFTVQLSGTTQVHHSRKDLRNHFFNFCRARYRAEQKEKSETTPPGQSAYTAPTQKREVPAYVD